MFNLGIFYFRTYGIIISFAFLISFIFGYFEVKRKKYSLSIYIDLALISLIGGLIGARAYHVIHKWPIYLENPYQIIQIWRGGMGIYGAIFGALIFVYIYSRIKKINLLPWLDIAAIVLPLGQAVGRWANYYYQELYGFPTNLPWAIYIDKEKRLTEFKEFSHFHPLFLYEFIWSLIIFSIVLVISRRYSKYLLKGELFMIYASLYSLGRFFIEYLKPNVWRIFEIPAAQLISILIIIACMTITHIRRRK